MSKQDQATCDTQSEGCSGGGGLPPGSSVTTTDLSAIKKEELQEIKDTALNDLILQNYIDIVPLIAENYTPITSEPVDNIVTSPKALGIALRALMRHFILAHKGTRVHIHYTFERVNDDLFIYLDGMAKSRFSLRPDVRTKDYQLIDAEALGDPDVSVANEMLPYLGGSLYQGDDAYTRAFMVKISANMDAKATAA